MFTVDQLQAQSIGRPFLAALTAKLRTGTSLTVAEQAHVEVMALRICADTGDDAGVGRHLARAQALAAASGVPDAQVAVLVETALLAWRKGNAADAQALCVQAEAFNHEPYDAARLAQIRGLCASQTGDINAAERYFDLALVLHRDVGSVFGRAQVLNSLANLVHAQRGQLTLVRQVSNEVIRLFDSLGLTSKDALGIQCWLFTETEDVDGLARALTRYQDNVLPGTHDAGMALVYAARVDGFKNDLASAHERLTQALGIAYKTGSPYLGVIARHAVAELHARSDAWALAHSWAEDMLRESARVNLPQGSHAARVMLARVALAWQDVARAREHLAIAQTGARQIEDELLLSEIGLWQVVCAGLERSTDRAQLWAAAMQRIRERDHIHLLKRMPQLAQLLFLQRMATHADATVREQAVWVATHGPNAQWVTHTIGVSAHELELIGLGRDDARPLIARVLAGDVLYSHSDRAYLMLHESFAHEMAGRLVEAARMAQTAHDVAARDGIPAAQAAALSELAYHANYRCDWQLAVDLGARSVQLDAASAYTHTACRSMALGHYNLGRWELAEHAWQAAEAAARNHGDARAMCMVFYGLAPFRWEQGRDAVAIETSRQCARFGAQSGFWEFAGLELQASYMLQTGRVAEARVCIGQMAAAVERSQWVRSAHAFLSAQLALAEGDGERAAVEAQEVARITREQGRVSLQPAANLLMAQVDLQRGKTAPALAWVEQAHADAARLGMLPVLPHARLLRAKVLMVMEEPVQAMQDLVQAIALADQLGAARLSAHARLLLGLLLQGPAAVAMLHDAAQRVRRGGYDYLLDQERALLLPRLASLALTAAAALQPVIAGLLESLAKAPPKPMRIRGLGGFSIQIGNVTVDARELERRRAGELFRVLLLAPGQGMARDMLLDQLWPNTPVAAAQQSLNQASSVLRRVLEPDMPAKFPSRYLSTEGERVQLRLPRGSSVDVFRFEAASLRGEQDALALYAGELFPADRFCDWAAAPRERLRGLFVHVSNSHAQASLDTGDAARALALARAVIAQDAWDEVAVLVGMKAALALHDRRQALLLYRALEKALREGLQLAPNTALTQLAGTITSDGQ